MSEKENLHIGYKTMAKIFGLMLGVIYVLLDVIFVWIPQGATLVIISSTLGGFAVLVIVVPAIVYLGDLLHVLVHRAKQKN